MKFLIAFAYFLFQVYTKSYYINVIFAVTFIDQADISLNTLPKIGLHTNSPSIIKIATKLSEGRCRKKKTPGMSYKWHRMKKMYNLTVM